MQAIPADPAAAAAAGQRHAWPRPGGAMRRGQGGEAGQPAQASRPPNDRLKLNRDLVQRLASAVSERANSATEPPGSQQARSHHPDQQRQQQRQPQPLAATARGLASCTRAPAGAAPANCSSETLDGPAGSPRPVLGRCYASDNGGQVGAEASKSAHPSAHCQTGGSNEPNCGHWPLAPDHDLCARSGRAKQCQDTNTMAPACPQPQPRTSDGNNRARGSSSTIAQQGARAGQSFLLAARRVACPSGATRPLGHNGSRAATGGPAGGRRTPHGPVWEWNTKSRTIKRPARSSMTRGLNGRRGKRADRFYDPRPSASVIDSGPGTRAPLAPAAASKTGGRTKKSVRREKSATSRTTICCHRLEPTTVIDQLNSFAAAGARRPRLDLETAGGRAPAAASAAAAAAAATTTTTTTTATTTATTKTGWLDGEKEIAQQVARRLRSFMTCDKGGASRGCRQKQGARSTGPSTGSGDGKAEAEAMTTAATTQTNTTNTKRGGDFLLRPRRRASTTAAAAAGTSRLQRLLLTVLLLLVGVALPSGPLGSSGAQLAATGTTRAHENAEFSRAVMATMSTESSALAAGNASEAPAAERLLSAAPGATSSAGQLGGAGADELEPDDDELVAGGPAQARARPTPASPAELEAQATAPPPAAANQSGQPEAPAGYVEGVTDFARIFAMVAIMIGDICGNSLVILSVVRHSKLRVTTNWFVVSLACADILVALFAMTFNASVQITGRWIFPRWMCDFWNSCDVLASTASILHLCCISIDRYYAIMRPLDYPMKITTRRVCYALALVWFASALLSYIPIFTGIYTTSEHIIWQQANPDQCEFVVNRVYAIVSSSISFWIPCCIMVFTYYKIYQEATRQEKFIYKAQSMMPAPQPAANHAHQQHQQANSAGKQRRSKSMAITSLSSKANSSSKARIQQLAAKQQEQQAAVATSSSDAINVLPDGETPPAPKMDGRPAGEQQPLTADLAASNNGAAKKQQQQQQQPKKGDKKSKQQQQQQQQQQDDQDERDSNSGQSTPTKRSISKMKREHKAAKTLGIIMGVFILCWLPFFSWYTPMHICGHACDGIVPHNVVTLLFWIGYFNSTLNPIIYAYFNHEFRDAFKKTLQWIFCCCRDLRCLRVQRPNDNQHYNCTYRSTQEIGLVTNG